MIYCYRELSKNMLSRLEDLLNDHKKFEKRFEQLKNVSQCEVVY